MSKGLTDAQIEKLADRIIKFETKKGSFQGTKLSIADFTKGNPYLPGQVKTREDLIGLIKDYYIPAVKEDLGEENFNKLDTSIIYELADWNFNSGRSATDVLAYAAGDITLDKWNKSGKNPLPKNFDKITLRQVEAAKHDGYKTNGKNPATGERYTIEEPNPAYEKTWKKRIGSTQDNPDEYKKYFEDKEIENTERRARLKKVGIYNDPKSSLRETVKKEKTPDNKTNLDNIQQEEIEGVPGASIPTIDTPVASSTEDTTINDEEKTIDSRKKLPQKEFIEKYYPIVKQSIEESGSKILPEVAMTQLIIENGYKNFDTAGTSFGVKATPEEIAAGDFNELETSEVIDGKVVKRKEKFSTAGSFKEAVDKYLGFFEKNKGRYGEALNETTVEGQLGAIASAGYATIEKGYTDENGKVVQPGGYTERLNKTFESNKSLYESSANIEPSQDYDLSFLSQEPSDAPTKTRINFKDKKVAGNYPIPLYETSWTNPDGKTHSYINDGNTEIKIIGNNSYLVSKERGVDLYRRFGTEDDDNAKKRYRLEKVYDNELSDLEKKVKNGNHLSKKELQLAESIYDFKEEELNDKIESLYEGYVDDDRESGVKNKAYYREQIKKNKEKFYNNIIKPEEKKYIKEDIARQEEELKKLKSNIFTGSSAEIKAKTEAFKKKKKQFQENKSKAIKDYNNIARDKTGEIYKEGIYANPTKSGVSRRRELVEKEFIDLKDRLYNNRSIPENINESETATQPSATDGLEGTLGVRRPIDSRENVFYTGQGIATEGATEGETKVVTASEVDPNNVIDNLSDLKDIAAYVDEEYLLKQNDLDQETIDFINSQKEVTSELPEEEEDYDSILGTIADIGKGVIGLAGATEDLPEYNTGQVYNEYIDDARRMKDQGLSAEEENYMTGKARNAFEFGIKQYRGAGSSEALVGAANQAAILQDQYGKIAAIDQGVRRDNRRDFARAAITDEGIQRKKFEDEYNEIANNKKEGAALARDAYNNASERVQFEKQYGKDSQYAKYMNESMLSMRQNREYQKQATDNKKQMTIKKLKEQQEKRNQKIKNNKKK